MDGWIVIPRWDEFQHRDMARSSVPPWIKNYTKLLHDPAYLGLTGHQRGVLHGVWLEYASARRQLTLTTRSLTRRLGVRVMTRDIEALIDAGFIKVSASKPASHLASLEVEVEVEKKEVLRTSRNTGPAAPAKAAAGPTPTGGLMAAARRYVVDWKGGGSDAFDEGLDELEDLYGAKLQAGDRYRLWDEAFERQQVHH